MRVVCRHGHFAFYPRTASDVSKFANYYNADIESEEDYFTFSFLAGLPRYSLKGKLFGNLPAVKTYEGRNVWDVMFQNGFVFNLDTLLFIPKTSITISANPIRTNFFHVSKTPLIQPGSVAKSGLRILSYSAEFIVDIFQLRVTELSYV